LKKYWFYKKGLQLWLDYLKIQSKNSLKQPLNFSDKKGLQLWSVLLKFQAVKQLKQRLVFSEKKGFQLWSDFLHIHVKHH